MARNGSGTYSVVNTFVAGTAITAATHNANWTDIASEMTNSVAVDGQSTMTGPLKASSGTAAAPSHTFGSDTDTGAYRIGSNNYGIAAGGTKIVDIATTGATVTGILDATTIKQGGFALLPVGLGPLQWTGRTAPSGWVLAGATYSRSTYAALWAFASVEIAAGNTLYGVGDGSTTFTIATMDGYASVGTDASGTRIAAITDVGDTAGVSTHAISLAELPTGITSTNAGSIALSVTSANYLLGNTTTNAGSAVGGGTQLTAADPGSGAIIARATSTGTIAIGDADVTSNNTSGTAMSLIQPVRAFSYIIFAGA